MKNLSAMNRKLTQPIPIFINSRHCKNGSKSLDFRLRFTPVMEFDINKDYYVALNDTSMSYSWYNVSSSYDNNKLKYSHDSGTTWHEITLPNGNFAYNELSAYIQRELEVAKHSKEGITMEFVSSLYKV